MAQPALIELHDEAELELGLDRAGLDLTVP
jgi:hypothetical protein